MTADMHATVYTIIHVHVIMCMHPLHTHAHTHTCVCDRLCENPLLNHTHPILQIQLRVTLISIKIMI